MRWGVKIWPTSNFDGVIQVFYVIHQISVIHFDYLCDYHFDFKSPYLTSAVKKFEIQGQIFDTVCQQTDWPHQNLTFMNILMTQVEVWRNKCVLPKWWDTNMKSNFDVGLEIWSKVTILSHTWAILMNFFAHLVISHFPIDHMTTKGFFMTLKLAKSALKGILPLMPYVLRVGIIIYHKKCTWKSQWWIKSHTVAY